MQIRGLNVEEADLLANTSPKATKRVDAMDMLFGRCFVELLDAGPYSFTEIPIWQSLLTGDREALLIAIRTATFGPEYKVRLHCQNDRCQHPFLYSVNLDELPIQHMSEEARDIFANDNRFEATLGNTRFIYQLGTGKLQRKHAQQTQTKPDQIRALALNLRVLEIHQEGKLVHVNEKFTFLTKLPMRHALELQAEMDRNDCGVDATLYDVECPQCRREERYDLPFDEEFFRPKSENMAATSRMI